MSTLSELEVTQIHEMVTAGQSIADWVYVPGEGDSSPALVKKTPFVKLQVAAYDAGSIAVLRQLTMLPQFPTVAFIYTKEGNLLPRTASVGEDTQRTLDAIMDEKTASETLQELLRLRSASV